MGILLFLFGLASRNFAMMLIGCLSVFILSLFIVHSSQPPGYRITFIPINVVLGAVLAALDGSAGWLIGAAFRRYVTRTSSAE